MGGVWSDALVETGDRQRGLTHSARRRSAWLVSLPLVVLGSLAAHQLAYLAVAGDHVDALLAETGHGYLDQLPTGAVLGLVCVVLGLGLAALDRVRGARGKTIPVWLIALVPLLGFALQEHVERLAHTGHVPWSAALEATFLAGLGLQLPFAALAYLVARALLQTVAAVVTALLARSRPTARRRMVVRRADDVRIALATGLARRLAPRGPPPLRIG